MTEKVLKGSTTAGEPAHIATDVDTEFNQEPQRCGKPIEARTGSAAATTDGHFFGAAHVEDTPLGNSAHTLTVDVREGMSKSMPSAEVTDRFEPQPYLNSDSLDFTVYRTNLTNTPSLSTGYFKDASGAHGPAQAHGYVGDDKIGNKVLEGETLVQSSGYLSPGPLIDDGRTKFRRFDLDVPGTEGLGAVGGMSGGPVTLGYSLESDNSNADSIQFENLYVGSTTYGSGYDNKNYVPHSTKCGERRYTTSLDATDRAAGFTPFVEDSYASSMNYMTENRSTDLQIEEEFEARKDAYRDAAEAKLRAPVTQAEAEKATAKAENEAAKADLKTAKKGGNADEISEAKADLVEAKSDYKEAKENVKDVKKNTPDFGKDERESADAELRAEIRSDPDLPDRVAGRYKEGYMFDDYDSPDNSTYDFDGSGIGETLYVSSQNNVTSDLGAGRDTVDLHVPRYGVTVEIGANADGESVLNVTKTYDKADGSGQAQAHDVYTDAEAVNGTYANDTYIINDFADFEAIDGRDPKLGDDIDTLKMGPNVGPVSWTFDKNPDGTNKESGTVSDGTNEIPFQNIENAQPRPGDKVDGVEVPALAPAPTPTTGPTQHSDLLTLPEAGAILQAAMPEARADMAARAAERPLTEDEAGYADLLDSADIPVVMTKLHEDGAKTLDVTGKPMETVHDQVGSIAESAVAEMKTRDIPYPQAEIDAAHAAQAAEHMAANDSYQNEYNRSADDDVGAFMA